MAAAVVPRRPPAANSVWVHIHAPTDPHITAGIPRGNFAASGPPRDRRRRRVDDDRKQLALDPSARRERVRRRNLRWGDEWEWVVRPPLRSHAATASTRRFESGDFAEWYAKMRQGGGRFGKSGGLNDSLSNWPLWVSLSFKLSLAIF